MSENQRITNKRPGPRLSVCPWCGKVTCNHCRCTGEYNCCHAPGEMCKNHRYKRRLVCNSCEKNKLKYRQMCQQKLEKEKEKEKHAKESAATKDSDSKSLLTESTEFNKSKTTTTNRINSGNYLQIDFIPCPNIAVMLYRENLLISLIPISSIQGNLAQLRKYVNDMMILQSDAKYVFIRDIEAVAIEEESNIRAKEIVRQYGFHYPINCTRCFFIHCYNLPCDSQSVPLAHLAQPVQPTQPTQSMQPVQPVQPVQPMQPVQPVQPTQSMQPVQPAWQTNAFTSYLYSHPLPYDCNDIIKNQSNYHPIKMPYSNYILSQQRDSTPSLLAGSIDSKQWTSPIPKEQFISPQHIALYDRNSFSESLSLQPFREEAYSADMATALLHSFPYGDINYNQYNQRYYPRPSASSDLNWPTYLKCTVESEEQLTPATIETGQVNEGSDKQQISPRCYEETQTSTITTNVKKEIENINENTIENKNETVIENKNETTLKNNEKESVKVCDHLSVMANIAKQELQP